jgi:hypothetical protein
MFGVGQINTGSGSYPDQIGLLLSDCGDVVTKKSANQQRVDVRRDEEGKGTML